MEHITPATIDSILLPEPLRGRYRLLSCLKDAPERKVFLLEDLLDGEHYILKVASEPYGAQLRAEHETLLALHAPGFPRPLHCFAWQSCVCSIRSYVPGVTLAEHSESHSLSAEEVIRLLLEACRIVQSLHALTPPRIHRDLSAQNFILTPDGSLVLIDLDTVHAHSDTKPRDTMLLGTPGLAAPEQYGVQQSSASTDVYGLGMLMVYLFTNDYDVTKIAAHRLPHSLRQVIRKSTQFDPERRYPTVAAMQSALATHRRRSPARLALKGVAACAAILLGVVGLMQWLAASPPGAYAFQSPQIEQLVRRQLDKPTGPLLESDLANITSLLICGDTPFDDWGEVQSYGYDNIHFHNPDWRMGHLSTLEDLRHMTNLRQLAIYKNGVSDLSPLMDLPLSHLALTGNPVRDLTPLAGIPSLQALDLNGTYVSDLSPLAELPVLSELLLVDSLVYDMSPVAGMPIRRLHLSHDNIIQRPEALATFQSLDFLWMYQPSVDDVTQVAKITSLRQMYLCSTPTASIAECPMPPGLTDLGLQGPYIKSLDGIEQYQTIERIAMHFSQEMDLSPLAALENLRYLNICDIEMTDYSALADCKALDTIALKEWQVPLMPTFDQNVNLEVH